MNRRTTRSLSQVVRRRALCRVRLTLYDGHADERQRRELGIAARTSGHCGSSLHGVSQQHISQEDCCTSNSKPVLLAPIARQRRAYQLDAGLDPTTAVTRKGLRIALTCHDVADDCLVSHTHDIAETVR